MENHICFVLKNLELFNHRFFSSKSIEDLPRIYVNNPELRREICCEHHELDKKIWILQWYSSRYKMYVKFLWLELRLASPTTMLTLSVYYLRLFLEKEKMIFIENLWLKQFIFCWYWFTSFCSFVYKKNQRSCWNVKKKSQNSEFMWSKAIKYYENSLLQKYLKR